MYKKHNVPHFIPGATAVQTIMQDIKLEVEGVWIQRIWAHMGAAVWSSSSLILTHDADYTLKYFTSPWPRHEHVIECSAPTNSCRHPSQTPAEGGMF